MANILVVDDSPITRAMIMEFLQMLGHHVAGEAEDLAQTLAAYAAHRPGLVTLDLSMSRENGFTILRALRAVDPKAKVLIISGNSQPKIYEQLLAEGAAGFIAKPISIDALAAALAKVLAA
ncbi:MAG: response regulator [Elusimicrobiota bacterium]